MGEVMDRAYEVQEAAAAAALEENDGGFNVGPRNLDFNGDPWPEDPYDDSLISGIPDAYAWADDIDYSGLPAKQKAVTVGGMVLDNAQGGFDRLTSLLGNENKFRGASINAFIDYLGIIESAAEDQGNLAEELAAGVRSVETILEATKTDVLTIADNTITACNGIKEAGDAADIEAQFLILGIAVGLTTAAFTGGMGWALLAAGLTAAQGAYALNATGNSETGLGGDDLETVLNGDTGMYKLLEKRQQDWFDADNKLAEGLQADLKHLDGKGPADRLDSLNPDPGGIVKDRGNFRPTGAVLGDMEELYELATGHGASASAKSNVPALAKEFATATRFFNKANGTEAVAMGASGLPWEQLLDKLQRLTARAGENLYDGGTTLGKAAQDFARQDGESAKWIEEEGDKFIDRKDPTFPAPEAPDYYVIPDGPYKGKPIPL